MEFLTWFPASLKEFQKPPLEGGLSADAMTSLDQNIGGEMLCIQRSMNATRWGGGYTVVNRSRCNPSFEVETKFMPHQITWGENFLFEGGLLNLIKELGEKFEQGKL